MESDRSSFLRKSSQTSTQLFAQETKKKKGHRNETFLPRLPSPIQSSSNDDMHLVRGLERETERDLVALTERKYRKLAQSYELQAQKAREWQERCSFLETKSKETESTYQGEIRELQSQLTAFERERSQQQYEQALSQEQGQGQIQSLEASLRILSQSLQEEKREKELALRKVRALEKFKRDVGGRLQALQEEREHLRQQAQRQDRELQEKERTVQELLEDLSTEQAWREKAQEERIRVESSLQRVERAKEQAEETLASFETQQQKREEDEHKHGIAYQEQNEKLVAMAKKWKNKSKELDRHLRQERGAWEKQKESWKEREGQLLEEIASLKQMSKKVARKASRQAAREVRQQGTEQTRTESRAEERTEPRPEELASPSKKRFVKLASPSKPSLPERKYNRTRKEVYDQWHQEVLSSKAFEEGQDNSDDTNLPDLSTLLLTTEADSSDEEEEEGEYRDVYRDEMAFTPAPIQSREGKKQDITQTSDCDAPDWMKF